MEHKLAPIRKGLLEFLVLKIVGARRVYVPDILRRLAATEFATQEGTLYPLLKQAAPRGARDVRVEGIGRRSAAESTTA